MDGAARGLLGRVDGRQVAEEPRDLAQTAGVVDLRDVDASHGDGAVGPHELPAVPNELMMDVDAVTRRNVCPA
jgi:hypothetical protein